VIGSPYGLTITPMGTPTSFYRELEFGMRSVVTLSTDLSELNSSNDDYDYCEAVVDAVCMNG
jgi:hypothetical protein